jgi:hypothetical protein
MRCMVVSLFTAETTAAQVGKASTGVAAITLAQGGGVCSWLHTSSNGDVSSSSPVSFETCKQQQFQELKLQQQEQQQQFFQELIN